MTSLSDAAVKHLRAMADLPDLSETKYRLGGPLGRGGMGTVYVAHDAELDRDVALKVVGPLGIRLSDEAKILARLEHPGIVPVHDVGVLPDGRVFYAMKLVRGERLDAVFATSLTLLDRLRIFDRICDAVAFAHSQGVIHRDLKPANIMVGQFGEVLVLDWGVAAFTRRETLPAVVGTAGYMSPEQSRGETADERSDIHALGVILEQLLPTPAPKSLRAVCAKASAEHPSARYQQVGELAEDLRRYREGLPLSAYRETLIERAARVAAKYQLPIALIAAYVLMRAVLLLFAR
jgi:serine/threonine protein kinase